jgi:hypothetical protein
LGGLFGCFRGEKVAEEDWELEKLDGLGGDGRR